MTAAATQTWPRGLSPEAQPQPAPSCWGHQARARLGSDRGPRKGVGQWTKRARPHAWAGAPSPTALPGTRPREQRGV